MQLKGFTGVLVAFMQHTFLRIMQSSCYGLLYFIIILWWTRLLLSFRVLVRSPQTSLLAWVPDPGPFYEAEVGTVNFSE